jgi:hypothetical protein
VLKTDIKDFEGVPSWLVYLTRWHLNSPTGSRVLLGYSSVEATGPLTLGVVNSFPTSGPPTDSIGSNCEEEFDNL